VVEQAMQTTRLRAFLLVATLVLLAIPARRAGAAAQTVREPAFGLPHIFADTDLELARENGREIAKDRLAQLILLSRVGRGTLSQAFSILDPSTLDDDIEARRTAYTSSELNRMFDRLPAADRAIVLAYCAGVNDVVDEIYAGTSPEPIEINLLRSTLGLDADLFGNATNVSDQVDPYYRAPGGADPERPAGGFQFTPEMALSIAVLEVRNFGFNTFEEDRKLADLQALIAKHGGTAGTQIWRDLYWLNDPLAPVTVPDPTTPGYGGPLAKRTAKLPGLLAAAKRYPRRDWSGALALREARAAKRAELATRLGAWPKLGSYAWAIAGNRSATGNPWIGGFPQTGIQTPSIMHFVENRSRESIQAIGMEFAGAPFVLIGQTDTVAYTTTTAQARVVDTVFEDLVLENANAIRYSDEGTPAALSKRIEVFAGTGAAHTFWRSHERNGNLGSRPVVDFIGDVEGTATGGTAISIVDASGPFGADFIGGFVAIVDGTGAGQIRAIGAANDIALGVVGGYATTPDDTSVYVAVRPGQPITAVALDSAVWQEESTAVLGFARLQQAEDVLDVREAVRLIPSTHNFPAADNRTWNGIGTNLGRGNIAYYSSGFARHRGAAEKLLPIEGSGPNPLVTTAGTVDSATATTLRHAGAFAGLDLRAPEKNYRYHFPGLQGTEYVVLVTSGVGAKQTRRIAANDGDTLQLEAPWGVVPAPGDTYEVQAIVAMAEAINPAEGYTANWNNKAATADDVDGFGRNHRVDFILEALANDSAWDRAKQRQLNADVAGLESRGRLGRHLVPRLREAVDALGNGGVVEVDAVLAQLEAFEAAPTSGRRFVDPVEDTQVAGEIGFLNPLIADLASAIYGDEYDGAVGVPGGERALALVTHAIDSAAGDVPGSYAQQYAGDYFGGDWKAVLRDVLAARAPAGIPAPTPRPNSSYNHPLSALLPELSFPQTPAGNRGIWEQIVEVGPVVNGEFIFPLGQSGHVEGSLAGVTAIDPNVLSLHPIWRDWRFVPMLHVSEDLERSGTPDADGDGAFDGFERWYFGSTKAKGKADADKDGLSLAGEFAAGLDPTAADTDGDGVADGIDRAEAQDRFASGVGSVKGRFDLPGGSRDRLVLDVRFGTPAAFDPETDDFFVRLSDDDGVSTLFIVELTAGQLTTKNGKSWVFTDPGGPTGVDRLTLDLGGKKGAARLRLRTVPTDFSQVTLDPRTVRVEIGLGGFTVSDERTWGPKRGDLVSSK
jgi:hypothetical protein